MNKYYCNTYPGQKRGDYVGAEASGSSVAINSMWDNSDTPQFLTPADARLFAADVLAAADKVEGVGLSESIGTRLDTLERNLRTTAKDADENHAALLKLGERVDEVEHTAKEAAGRAKAAQIDETFTRYRLATLEGEAQTTNLAFDRVHTDTVSILSRLAALEAQAQPAQPEPEPRCTCGAIFHAESNHDGTWFVGCVDEYCHRTHSVTAPNSREAKRLARAEQNAKPEGLRCPVCGGEYNVEGARDEWANWQITCDNETCMDADFSIRAGTKERAVYKAAIILGQAKP